jgi:hypothetical protein
MPLVDLTQAKAHLRITVSDADADITLKLAQAEAIVLQRCSSTVYWREIAAAWTSVTVPLAVQAAILLVLTGLYELRGDDMTLDFKLWEAVDRLLQLNKDPVLA